MSNFNDDTKIYSDEEFSNDSDDSDEENFDSKIQMKKIKCMNLFLEKIRKI